MCSSDLKSTLFNADLPTFGSPTIPALSILVSGDDNFHDSIIRDRAIGGELGRGNGGTGRLADGETGGLGDMDARGTIASFETQARLALLSLRHLG